MVNSTSYQSPIDKLLTLGSQQLNDVAELGISSEHIPDLIKLAVDDELLGADNEKEAMAPVHAWRILGQLQATDAIIPLIQLFKLVDNDLVNEELPKVYGNIGTAAIPALVKYLAQNQNQLLARVTAINSLEEIANQHPEASNQVKSLLTQSLQSCNQNEAELNGFIISALINLQSLISAPVIKYAFNTNQVAEDIVGNWDEVRESLGISSDKEVQEFIPTPVPSITEASTPDVEEASEDEINALIDLVAQVTETQTSTPENALSTNELASEVVETQTQTPENQLLQDELASEVTETQTPTPENTLLKNELASEVIETQTSTEENALPTNELASEVVETQTSTEENVLSTPELASEVVETQTSIEENALPTNELASETENTSLLSDEPEVEQEIINTEENLTNTIDKAEDEIEVVASEIEVSQETQVTDEVSTQVDESHKQTKDDKTEAVSVESSEELDSLEQEDNKGFGRPATSKEKPEKPEKVKPSKKKKRGFSDL
ncbi:MAG: hypothetical protein KME29_15655 [Calothrix sp. FI2-JRJ7]|jgi:hypothetical protein|nr:hypothetical protein [Calothrix sp. FI2-JRJ7]